MSPERDDYLDDDGKDSRAGRPGPLAAGWLRALIVLGGLGILLIVTVPYIIEWIAPSAPLPPTGSVKPEALATAPAEPVKPEPVAPAAPAPTPAPAATPATPAPAAAPAAAPAPKAETPASSEKPALPPRPEPESKPAVAAKSATKDAAPANAAPSKQVAAKASPPAPRTTAAAVKPAGTPTPASGGDYWIQVGLFANSDNAERLAKELRDERFTVEIAQTTRGDSSAPVNQHEVLVTGSTVEAVTAALKGTGTAEASASGVVVKPAMDLKDAVTLSRRLAGEGLQVRIRRVTASTAGGTLYLVRVGGYPTRDAAVAGKRELAAKGVTGFLTQGPVK